MPSDGISCGKGYWGCISNCCAKEPSIPPTNGNSPSTNPHAAPVGGAILDPAVAAAAAADPAAVAGSVAAWKSAAREGKLGKGRKGKGRKGKGKGRKG